MRYGSFLVRIRRPEGRSERIELEHIQSGAAARVASYSEAFAWMEAQIDGAPNGRISAARDGAAREEGGDD
ncbi:MAG: hypothetical protein LC793_16115 [Thermomicrobia bacterium]|nr:hypothetical protein [Thermomicrobia bacterium]